MKNSTLTANYKIYTACGIVVVIFLGTLIIFSNHRTHSVVIKIVDPIYAADFSNDRVLMGASHNVFVGKVVRQIGTKERGVGPETQFEVEIVTNIKGDLEGVVVVDQIGGYKDDIFYMAEQGGHDADNHAKTPEEYLLHAGSTYLLATRYNEKENWFTLNSFHTASKLVSQNEELSKDQLAEIARSDQRVRELKTAYAAEVPLQADVVSGNARNKYQASEGIE